jgi:tripartite-type tricarboxylate transporter receptor subunit TctC
MTYPDQPRISPRRRGFVFGASMALCAFALTAPALGADAYPSKPVRLYVGYVPGGSADSIARLFAQELGSAWGQPVIVENRPGASGSLAAGAAARAPADGYTILLGSNANAINVSLYKNLSFDLRRDLAPVALLTTFPNILAINPALPVHNVTELIAYARAHPGGVNFASSGAGSSTNLAAALFASKAGIQVTHIPYKGSAPALTDLMAGQVDAIFDNAPSVLPFVQSNKVRALGVTSRERQPASPDIPTISESGLPGFEVTSWYGLFLPAGTPAPVVQALNRAVDRALAKPDVRRKLAVMGATPEGGSVQRFDDHVGSEIAKWAEAVKVSGASAE